MQITYKVEVDEEIYECADVLRRVIDQTVQDFLRQIPRNSRIDTPFEMAED